MPGPASTDDLLDLQREIGMLHDRLHRIAVALAITEDLVAETYDRLADGNGVRRTEHRLSAKQARAAADACRAFVIRLDEIAETSVHG